MLQPIDIELDSCDYRSQLVARVQDARQIAQQNIQTSQRKQKFYHDRGSQKNPYCRGDKVWIFFPNIAKGKTRKLSHRWRGLYRVIERIRETNLKVQLCNGKNTKQHIVHVNRCKFCYGSVKPLVVPEEPYENKGEETCMLNELEKLKPEDNMIKPIETKRMKQKTPTENEKIIGRTNAHYENTTQP